MSSDGPRPLVSIIMANFNAEAHVAAAVRCALRQTLASLELIFSDDGSSDRSLMRARAAAGPDPRFRVLAHGARGGPAAARNRAIAAARGRWLAIADSDDLMHPERLLRLITAAERDGADIAADDLLVFHDDGARRPHAFLAGDRAKSASWVSAADYIGSDMVLSGKRSLGYLKPVIRRDRFAAETLAYNEDLRIAEDFDLVARLLLAGARMRLYPELTYFYRKHGRSISHRLSAADLDAMLAAHDRLSATAADPATRRALDRRRASLLTARAFSEVIAAMKAGRVDRALGAVVRRPATVWLLRIPILDRLARQVRAKPPPEPRAAKRIALLSGRRVAGADTSGSSGLLRLARRLADAGFAVNVIETAPKPSDRRLPAPRQADAAQAQRRDELRVARRARAGACIVICDEAAAPLAPFVLAPEAPRLTILDDQATPHTAGRTDGRQAAGAGRPVNDDVCLLRLDGVLVTLRADDVASLRGRLPEAWIAAATGAPEPP